MLNKDLYQVVINFMQNAVFNERCAGVFVAVRYESSILILLPVDLLIATIWTRTTTVLRTFVKTESYPPSKSVENANDDQ